MLISATTVDKAAAFSFQYGIKIILRKIFKAALMLVLSKTFFYRFAGIKTHSVKIHDKIEKI